MRSILEELFYGNVCPNTDCRSKDKETKELIGYIADHHSALNETLTDKQKEIFEKFNDCYDELTDINESEINFLRKTYLSKPFFPQFPILTASFTEQGAALIMHAPTESFATVL